VNDGIYIASITSISTLILSRTPTCLEIGTDPDDFIHTGHMNDLLFRYKITSDDVVAKAVDVLEKNGV